MDPSPFLNGDDDVSASSYAPLSLSNASLSPSSLHSMPPSSDLLHTPLSSLRQPRALLDWVFSIALNIGINYGLVWLEWQREFASSPVPLIDPWAEEEGRWYRGSLMVELLVTTFITVLLMTLLQGTILQFEVGRALRRPIRPGSITRPLSWFSALLEPGMARRIGLLEVQVGLPTVALTWLLLLLGCATQRNGLSCSVSTDAAIALKLCWVVVFVALFYPILVVGSINLNTLPRKRAAQYLERVAEQQQRSTAPPEL